MNNLSLIVAVGKNNEIGKDNKLLWHLKEDLEFFKNKTMNCKIVMGLNTFKSLPKLLPGREHLILTHKDMKVPGAQVYHVKEDLLDYLCGLDEEIYVIGGASTYEQFLPFCSKLYITEIDKEYDADAFFPEFDHSLYEREVLSEHEENGIKYKHVLYTKKKLD